MILAGIVGFSVGGVTYAVEESGEYSTQTREYDEIIVADGYGGLSGKGVAPYIQVTVRLDETQLSSDLNVRGQTIIATCEDRIVTLSGGSFVGKLPVDLSKNSVKAKFVGTACVEILS